MELKTSQSFYVLGGNLHKLIGSWPSSPEQSPRFAVTQDTNAGHALQSWGSLWHKVPAGFCVFALVCLMAFLNASPCPSRSMPTGLVPLLSGGGSGVSKRETLERATALKGPLFAPRAIFIFLTRNNTQSKSFHLAFFLFLAAGQGEEEASVRTFPLLRPQMEAVLRPCSLPYVMYVHVMCVHVCRRFGAWPCLGITHCTTLTRIYNLVGSHFPNSKIQALALTQPQAVFRFLLA